MKSGATLGPQTSGGLLLNRSTGVISLGFLNQCVILFPIKISWLEGPKFDLSLGGSGTALPLLSRLKRRRAILPNTADWIGRIGKGNKRQGTASGCWQQMWPRQEAALLRPVSLRLWLWRRGGKGWGRCRCFWEKNG